MVNDVFLDVYLDRNNNFVWLAIQDYGVYGIRDEVICFDWFVDMLKNGYKLYPCKGGAKMVLKCVKKGDKTYYILSICIDKKWYDKFITEEIFNSLKSHLKVV